MSKLSRLFKKKCREFSLNNWYKDSEILLYSKGYRPLHYFTEWYGSEKTYYSVFTAKKNRLFFVRVTPSMWGMGLLINEMFCDRENFYYRNLSNTEFCFLMYEDNLYHSVISEIKILCEKDTIEKEE